MTYTLTAELGSAKASRKFEASNPIDARFKAIDIILDLAHKKYNEWALGKITLTDKDGNILAEMEKKG